MAEETDEPSPQLTGIVIITLPPPDNPSFGKTITAYTISDHQTSSTHQLPQLNQPQSAHQNDEAPTHLVSNFPGPQSSSSFRIFFHRTLLSILSISLIALYVWVSISRQTFFQLRDDFRDDDDHQKNKSQRTFIFPLYQKHYRGNGDFGDLELKLGRFKKIDDAMGGEKINLIALKADATSFIPVGGNIYPDGLYYAYLHFGNPPRPYFLDVDSGSDLTWIQCDAPCTSCAKAELTERNYC